MIEVPVVEEESCLTDSPDTDEFLLLAVADVPESNDTEEDPLYPQESGGCHELAVGTGL